MNIVVSVIIPTYKRSDFIERAIESVLNQTYSNIEVVVVDDNNPATDYRKNTESRMSKYANNPKVVYLKNTGNMGGARARNEGISAAKGDYVTFLDDDDVYLISKVEEQLTFMLDHDYDLSFTDVRIHNKFDKLTDYREHPYVKSDLNSELLKQHIMHHLTPTDTYMFKKQALLDMGGFDSDVKMGQEFMLMLKSIEYGLKIGYIPAANVIQYLHDGERISVGQNKLDKEVELFEFKKKYFPKLSLRQRMYVRFRHHVVMTVIGMRSREFSTVTRLTIIASHVIIAAVSSPIDVIAEIVNHFKKVRRYKTDHLSA